MKKIITFFTALVLYANVYSQAPSKMSYQAVVRGTNDVLVSSAPVRMRISILQGSTTGTAVYSEIQNHSTNNNGLVTLEIGNGTALSGDFATIDWSSGPYFLKTETDPTGGTNFTITAVSQFMSVPYALYAERSGTPGPQGSPGPVGQTGLNYKGNWSYVNDNASAILTINAAPPSENSYFILRDNNGVDWSFEFDYDGISGAQYPIQCKDVLPNWPFFGNFLNRAELTDVTKNVINSTGKFSASVVGNDIYIYQLGQGISGNQPNANASAQISLSSFTGGIINNNPYLQRDVVKFDNALWFALQDNTNKIPQEGAYWTMFLPKGTPGTNGLTVSVNNIHQVNGNILLTSSDLGLGNVNNTSDADKPVSIATQAELDNKAEISSPVFTGIPIAPTAAPGTNTTQIATTEYVKNEVRKEFLHASISGSNNPTQGVSPLATVQGIAVSGDQITLHAGKTYQLIAEMQPYNFDENNIYVYQFKDVTNNVFLNNGVYYGNPNGATKIANFTFQSIHVLVTPSTDIQVEFQESSLNLPKPAMVGNITVIEVK